MIYKSFTVYDSKIEEFLPPFFCRSMGEAVRIMTNMCSDKNHDFYKYSSDYVLFEIGSYDTKAGIFDNLPGPKSLCVLTEYCNLESN